MKITLTRRAALDVASYTRAGVSGKSTIPILSNLLFTPDLNSGRVKVSGTDLELWLDASVRCELAPGLDDVEDELAFTINARILSEAISAMSGSDVTLSRDAGLNKVTLSSARAKFDLLCLPAEEFPAPQSVEAPAVRTLSCKTLKGMLKSVAYAMSTDNTRLHLCGVFLQVDASGLRATATNTHMLATAAERGYQPAEGDNPEVTSERILPGRAVGELIKNLPDEGEAILKLTDTHVVVSYQKGEGEAATRYTLSSRVIEGVYPNYTRVIPVSHTKSLTFDREEMIAALKRTAIVTRDNAGRVVMETRGMQVCLSGQSSGVGDVAEEVDVAREGDDIQIAFNNRYALATLEAVLTEGALLEASEPLRPVLVHPLPGQGDEQAFDWKAVLMPMQVI